MNSSGPAAALFANGSHSSPSSQPGSACQKAPSRIGNASEIVASEASNNDPSSAEPSNDRLNATSMANASVPNCTNRNASTPVACVATPLLDAGGHRQDRGKALAIPIHLHNQRPGWVELQRRPLPVGMPEEYLSVDAE